MPIPLFLVRLAAHVSNGCKSRIRPVVEIPKPNGMYGAVRGRRLITASYSIFVSKFDRPDSDGPYLR